MRITHRLAVVAAVLMASVAFGAADSESSWGSSWAPAAPMDTSMLTRRSADADSQKAAAAETQGRNYAVHEPIYSNDTDINAVIDQILSSRREGRNLGDQYEQVYADGHIDQALMQGNDMQARNLIRDKLCGLGLMSCDVEEKRPYYSTIYAQGPPPPSASFGGGPYGPPRPMPPPGHFSARPAPPASSLNSFGPPRKVGYESGYKPNYRPSGPGPMYTGPYLESPPPSAIGGSTSFNKPPPGSIIYGSKPPGPVYGGGHSDIPPYNFENPDKIQTAGSQHSNFYSHQSSSASAASASSSSTKVVIGNPAALPGAAAAGGLQQHVHHHFHHVDGGEAAGAKVPTVPIPIGAGQSISTDFSALAQSSTAFTPQVQTTQGGFTQSSAFNAGFNGASQGGLLSQGASGLNGGGLYKPNNGELYKPGPSGLGGYATGSGASLGSSGFGQSGYGQSQSQSQSFGQNSIGQSGSSFQGQSSFGQSNFGQAGTSGSYHSSNPDYFKKELHNVGSSSNYNGISTGYGGQSHGGQYQGGFDTARQQIVDCQCVPFNQCPAADRIGRKEDLILPIDPRNLGKDIEALSDDAAANITANANGAEKKSDEATTVGNNKDDDKESKRSKREAAAGDAQDDAAASGDLPLDAEGQRQDVPALQAIELLRRKILPTYGVSFGLPYPSGGGTGHGYPPNVHGDFYPAQNPHFGSIGPNGLNLGLLNVNPLVSLQVSKTEYGDKVVKPLVNLHVTPNTNIWQKVGDLFKRKPEVVHNTHYHHHDHYTGFEHPHHGFTGPEHYAASGPTIVEMVPSQPIFEYHSGSAVPPAPIPAPLHHHEHHHESFSSASSSSLSTFEHTSFGQQHATGPTAGSHYGSSSYPTAFGPTGHGGYNYGSSGFGAGDYYERSSNASGPLRFVDGPPTTTMTTHDGNNNIGNYDTYTEEARGDGRRRGKQLGAGVANGLVHHVPTQAPGAYEGSDYVTFPRDRRRRSVVEHEQAAESVLARSVRLEQRAYYGNRPVEKTCRVNEVCCRRPLRPAAPPQQLGRCGVRNAAGITGRIKNPVYVDGDSEFGEYPWHVAILKKDPKESIYACGGTLIDGQHVITAAHCIKSQNGFDLRARLGEWDVNHDVEFFPYIERDVVSVHIHPEYYAGTLDNDLAILKLDHPVDFSKNPHISPACLPDKYSDFTGARCWTTGWGKDAFGEHGKYQNILKEVDVPILSHQTCQNQLRQTRLGYSYKLNPGFLCAGGEEGKDACKGDGGGPLVCERNGVWNVVGVVSWGIGCGQVNVPGVYVRVAHYLDWIRQITQYYK